jgi:hypothetical protein
MSDTPEQSTEYQPEEGAEVRPVSRYAAPPVLPGGLEELAREAGDETPYRSVSLLAIGAFAVAVAYAALVAVGGVVAFWGGARAALLTGTVLVPLLSVPVAMRFGVRGWPGLLRVAGLALAAFYAVPVGVGGLVAFSSHVPYLLWLWTFAVPLLAAAAGLAARFRIQASEDTLSGKALATWAIGLSLFFALCYAAYYTATRFAVCLGAEKFADEWLQTVQQGDVLRAYVLTKEPAKRPTDPAAQRNSIELLSNPANDEEGFGFTGFGQRSYVRLLRGTSKSNVELVTVRDWDYERGGYVVRLSYRVTTPYWTFPMEVAVHGVESQKKDVKGRQWYVRLEMTGAFENNIQLTPRGQRLQELAGEGRALAEKWVMQLGRRDQNQMFQALAAARPGGERREAAWQAFGGAAGPGVRAAAAQEEPFFKGALVEADPKVFWTPPPPNLREPVVARAKRLFTFGAGGDEGFHVQAQRQPRWPLWDEDKATGRLLFRYETTADGLTVSYREPTPEGGDRQVDAKVNLEAFIVLSCQAAALESGEAPQWRVERVELVRARRADQGPPGMPGPGGTPSGRPSRGPGVQPGGPR